MLSEVGEHEVRAQQIAEKLHYEWQLLEALLFWASFSDGSLDQRVLALPRRAFAQAATYMDAIGWLRPGPPEGC